MAGSGAASATWVKKSEFARLRNVSPAYVTKLCDLGRIVLSEDGKRVHLEASIAMLEKSAHVDRAGVAEHHARTRLEKQIALGDANPITPPLPDAARPSPVADAAGDGAAGDGKGNVQTSAPREIDPTVARYNAARATSEETRAELARRELERSRGLLVERAGVERAGAALGDMLQQKLHLLRPRLVPLVAAEADPVKVDQMFATEIDRILQDIAEEAARLVQPKPDA